jgi:hypothetical protein
MVFQVTVLDDDGNRVLATRRQFADKEQADRYASACAKGRQALVHGCPRGVAYPSDVTVTELELDQREEAWLLY